MKHASIVLSFLFVLWGQNIPTRAQQHTAAKQMSWSTTIPDSLELGEPIEIRGRIYQSDGKMPTAFS